MKHLARALPIVAAVAAASVDAPAAAEAFPPVRTDERNAVPACATPERLMAFLRTRNTRLDRRFDGIAADYRRHGESVGLRWDWAFFQMIVETNGLSYRRPDGSPARVRPEQNNFAALGVRDGAGAESFADVTAGVAAHLRRLARVSRMRGGFAEVVRAWAPSDEAYVTSIEAVARRFTEAQCAGSLGGELAAARPPAARMATVAAEEAFVRRAAPVAEDPPRRRDRATNEIQLPPASRRQAPTEGRPTAGETPSGTDLARHAMARAEAPIDRRLAGVGIGEPRRFADSRGGPPALADEQPAERQRIAALALPAKPEAARPARDPADEAVHGMVVGRTVLLDTPIGTQIPIAFAEEGTMQGEARSLGWYLGASRDEGKWWVNKGRLCLRWKVWFDREIQCLAFRQQGTVIHWTSDKGKSGTARLAPRA